MASTPTIAASLLQTGMLVGAVVVAQVVVMRHLTLETIPEVLRGRVALSSRLRPWLIAAAAAMAASGLALYVT
jgi:hypothetical protein